MVTVMLGIIVIVNKKVAKKSRVNNHPANFPGGLISELLSFSLKQMLYHLQLMNTNKFSFVDKEARQD
ncbi:MAG: hypothetical protein ABI480_01740, partial [Chitinophagaceae bacterium]